MDLTNAISTVEELRKAKDSYEEDKEKCMQIVTAFTVMASDYAKSHEVDEEYGKVINTGLAAIQTMSELALGNDALVKSYFELLEAMLSVMPGKQGEQK